MSRRLFRALLILALLLPSAAAAAEAEPSADVTAAAATEPSAPAPLPRRGELLPSPSESAEPPSADAAKPAAKAADRVDARLSGYIQGRYAVVANTDFDPDDQNGFGLSDARLEGRGKVRTVQGDIFVRLQGDFGGGGFSLKDGFAGWAPYQALSLTIGQFKVPFAYAVLHSTRQLQLPDQQLATRLGWGRDLGAMISGDPELTKIDGRPFILHYAAGVFNGEGENQFRNSNDRNLYAGRLLVQPMGKIGDDESDLSPCLAAFDDEACDADVRRPLRVALGASLGHDPYSARGKNFDLNREETRWAVDAHAKWRGLSLHAEYVRADLPATANDGAFARDAWYVQAGYNPAWFPRLEPVVRYEYRDYDTARDNTGPGAAPDQVEFQSRSRTTVGLNALLTGYDGRLMLAYVMTDLREGLTKSPQGDPLYGDMVILQAQLGF